MTAARPAFQAAFVTVALFPHLTVTIDWARFVAVTVKVPDPAGPVSQMRTIVSGPAAAGASTAKAVVEIATAPTPASSAATADFKILIAVLLPEHQLDFPARTRIAIPRSRTPPAKLMNLG
jgi:hypothetical protein